MGEKISFQKGLLNKSFGFTFSAINGKIKNKDIIYLAKKSHLIKLEKNAKANIVTSFVADFKDVNMKKQILKRMAPIATKENCPDWN